MGRLLLNWALSGLILTGSSTLVWASAFEPRGICSLSDKSPTPPIPEIPGRQAMAQWSQCNPAKGVFDFTALENQISNCMADARQYCIIKLNGNYKPDWMTNEIPYLKGIQLTEQVENPDTLMYWHPTFKQAYRDLIFAYGTWLSNYTHRAFVKAVRQNHDAIGTEHTAIPAQYRSVTNWTIPAGCTIPPTSFVSSEEDDYKAMAVQEYIDHISPIMPIFIRCNIEDSILQTQQALFDTGVLGWFHTGAGMEQNQYFNVNWRYSRFLEYCRPGITYGFTENVQYYSFMNPGDEFENYTKAQCGYWYFLSGMHCGVSCLGLYSGYLNDLSSDPAFPNWLWGWIDKYAGRHADPAHSPGAWIALRGQGDNFAGDYTFLMVRLGPDTSTETNLVGGSDSIYSPWARSLPPAGTFAFDLNSGLFGGLPLASNAPLLKCRVVYWDGGSGNWELHYDAQGTNNKTAAIIGKTGANRWKEVTVPLPDARFNNRGPRGADVWVTGITGSPVIFHMLEVSTNTPAVVLTANEDAYVDTGLPTANRGTVTYLRVKGTGKIVYLKFNLTSLPEPIQGARLRLFSQNVSVGVTAKQVSDNSWTETSVTWNNKPALGADIATTLCASNSWCEWDVSSYIQSNGVYSIALMGNGVDIQDFTSKEGGTAPQLIITQTETPFALARPGFNRLTHQLDLSVSVPLLQIPYHLESAGSNWVFAPVTNSTFIPTSIPWPISIPVSPGAPTKFFRVKEGAGP